jgi:NADPH:quinone reductase-like Zn-dependent oxidoreductase
VGAYVVIEAVGGADFERSIKAAAMAGRYTHSASSEARRQR